jgi:dihydrodipicolinate synthase/N-acetylneuraminate lyase
MTMEEQRSVLCATRDGLDGRKALIGGACAPSLRQAIAHARLAKEAGCDACVACPPYYYPLSQKEIMAFYRELARAAELPVIMYHVPFFTSGIEAETVERLARIDNIIGIKDSSANMKRIAHLCQLHDRRPDFLIYTGTDDCLFPALCAGVDGSMTALAASLPDLVSRVYKAFSEGDMQEAGQQQRRMMPVLKAADALPFPLGYKLVAEAAHGLPLTARWHQLITQEECAPAREQIARLVNAVLSERT